MPNSKPIALAYAGHQFGYFVPQLGDGRALLLGEIKDKNDLLYDVQLKGSGRTFFSRSGDGKCPLDAAIREYILSEALYYLKVPSTRSLALVKSDKFIQRAEFLPAAVITRLAKSHIRVGTFEYFAARGDIQQLRVLADYTIKRHFPNSESHKNRYIHLLRSVLKLQAELVAGWLSIGFIHGVMNTDNTTVSGQTIDYGPCAFMDEYEHNKVFSSIDKMGRYGFSNQKNISFWNLVKFAEALLPLLDDGRKETLSIVEGELHKFPPLFERIYYKKMLKKLGVFDFKGAEEDKNLVDAFLDILAGKQIDFTNGFRVLSKVLRQEAPFYKEDQQYLAWQQRWMQRLQDQSVDFTRIAKKMARVNPILIPRNHIVADIIQKSVFKNDYSEFYEFLQALQNPFSENKKYAKYYYPPQEADRVLNTFCGT